MPRAPSAFGLGANESRPIRIRVPNDLADRWEAFVEREGQTAAEGYRVALRELMKGEGTLAARLARLAGYAATLAAKLPGGDKPPPSFEAKYRTGKKLDRSKTKRVELQLRESEHGAVAKIAKEGGITNAQWIVALVRAVLTRGVLAPSTELEALKQSTYQLTAIGRNLNQIAHHINADPTQLHRLKGEQIEKLASQITEHRRKVDALIDKTLERWVLIQEQGSAGRG